MLGQHHQRCALELAEQQKLLAATPRQNASKQASLCSPTAAAEALQEQPDGAEPPDDSLANRTPVAQLRADHQHAEDSSPCNNILRRLAADIKAGSAATLQATLTQYSFGRRSTASMRSRISSHSDCGSCNGDDDHTTPAASPGRSWLHDPVQPTTALDLNDTTSHSRSAGDAPEPSTEHLQLQDAGAGALSGDPLSDCSTSASRTSLDSCTVHAPVLAQDGPAVGCVPIIPFKGFADCDGSEQQALAAPGGSMQLDTPRLEPHWIPFNGSNHSSSNGTALTDHNSSCGGGCLVCAGDTSTLPCPCSNSHSQPEDTPIAALNKLLSESAMACVQLLGTDAAGTSMTEGLASQQETAGADDDSATQQRAAVDGSGDGGSSSSRLMELAHLSAVEEVGEDPGFWSCDEDGHEQQPQHAADSLNPLSEPSQLPLSPLLLRQLSQQLSQGNKGQEDGMQCSSCAGCVKDDDATTCCDWATVCSYEEIEP